MYREHELRAPPSRTGATLLQVGRTRTLTVEFYAQIIRGEISM